MFHSSQTGRVCWTFHVCFGHVFDKYQALKWVLQRDDILMVDIYIENKLQGITYKNKSDSEE